MAPQGIQLKSSLFTPQYLHIKVACCDTPILDSIAYELANQLWEAACVCCLL